MSAPIIFPNGLALHVPFLSHNDQGIVPDPIQRAINDGLITRPTLPRVASGHTVLSDLFPIIFGLKHS